MVRALIKYTPEDVERLVEAAAALWKAHGIVVSNGGGAWVRHVEPAIYELQKVVSKFRPEVMYAAGFYQGCDIDTGATSWGMFDGPTPDLQSLLSTCTPPEDKLRAYILEMRRDSDADPIKEWDGKSCEWKDY